MWAATPGRACLEKKLRFEGSGKGLEERLRFRLWWQRLRLELGIDIGSHRTWCWGQVTSPAGDCPAAMQRGMAGEGQLGRGHFPKGRSLGRRRDGPDESAAIDSGHGAPGESLDQLETIMSAGSLC